MTDQLCDADVETRQDATQGKGSRDWIWGKKWKSE